MDAFWKRRLRNGQFNPGGHFLDNRLNKGADRIESECTDQEMSMGFKRKKGATFYAVTGILAVFLGTVFAVIHSRSEARRRASLETVAHAFDGPLEKATTILHLAAITSSNFPPDSDIALMNLLCGESLNRADDNAVQSSVATLDQWVARVKSETQRHLYRFRAAPAEFENSEGYFRMVLMAVILYEDFGVRYNPKLISDPAGNVADYEFFANPFDCRWPMPCSAKAVDFEGVTGLQWCVV